MKAWVRTWLLGPGGDFLGRRNLVRIGSFLVRAGRRDSRNDMAENGELLVLEQVVAAIDSDDLTVVDCGANVGEWSLALVAAAARVRPSARVRAFAFEPSSYTYAQLEENLATARTDRTILQPVRRALSSEAGTVALKIAGDGAGTNSLVEVPNNYGSSESVEKVTLDEFARENDIARIHLLKIDVEGHDYEVLKGASELLAARRIDAVQFEYNWRWIYARRFLLDVYELVAPLGYVIGKVTPHGIQVHASYNPELETFTEGNYFFCLPACASRMARLVSWQQPPDEES